MITRMRRALGRFAGDRRGVSAVEFALLALLMIALYFGSVEVSDGVIADRKVTLTAAALANLTAQVPTISTSDMSNILDAFVGDHRALFGRQAEDHRVVRGHRRQQKGGAGRRQFAIDFR
jgi:Flp pilus assembly protein TadG